MRALLDSGARRNVLPLHVFNSFPTESRTPIEPSAAQVLQGIGPSGLAVLGEVNLPVQVGSRATNVNFVIADTTENTEVILGHPFLHQTSAQLDYGRREITLLVKRYLVLNQAISPGCTLSEWPAQQCWSLGGSATVNQCAHQNLQPGCSTCHFEERCCGRDSAASHSVEEDGPRAVLAPPGFEPTDSACASLPSHLQVLYNDSCGGLSGGDQESLARLLRSYSDVFSSGPTDLGRTGLVQHDILTTPGPTVKQQPRRMARDKQTAADQQVQQSLETGVARPSNSSWAAPIIMVKKKDETLRLCVDYRPLNERTIKDAYPLPRIQDTLDTLSTARYFSTLDLTSGYWQVEMTPRARKAAAFCTRKGLFEWNVMPFGLCNAPATFQRLMDRVLAGLQWETCLVYLDDIIVLGRDGTEMLERLSQVFGRLRVANLKLKPSKCVLFREQVVYLGHIVSAKGVATDPKRSKSGQLLLDTDASDWGIGAVLSQVQEGEERVLAYGSRRLSATEQNYCTTRRELLAAVEFTSHFRQYLLGRSFIIRTDHSSLRWLTRMREPEGQLARWLEKLAEYDFRVIHRPGRHHQNADALSRRPCGISCPCTVPEPSLQDQFQHKGIQCNMAKSQDAGETPAEQPPVGVVVPESSYGGSPAVEPEYLPVGVVDAVSDNQADSLFRPGVYRVSGPAQTNLFGGWTREELISAQEADPDIAPLKKRLELSHQLAREALGKSVERAKRQYDKNVCKVQHKVGDAVWLLIKGTKRVQNKVRKFLPSYEGPYFVVGVLDDLVYRIKRAPRAKMKVVHHDKLKVFHSRTTLDNDWVFQEAEMWAPVEAPSLLSDPSSSEIDIGPLDLWGESPETGDPVVGSLPGLFVYHRHL
ncbi:hypothetical protein DPEC_G00328090 [Dallia pectoralis]|uniref:Uncharacterized protein n=1 Tax=Dallia pectoralis TaxID=75939 RepID=A0ACC2F874_DALPE|nr:hypothetical protein DPEC_G00328090 [Dallia pectoralis]